jgi:hypothetical protein
MKALKRLLYLGYYLKQLDREKFHLFLGYTAKQTGKGKAAILADVVASVFKYNISILEYFQFRFLKRIPKTAKNGRNGIYVRIPTGHESKIGTRNFG